MKACRAGAPVVLLLVVAYGCRESSTQSLVIAPLATSAPSASTAPSSSVPPAATSAPAPATSSAPSPALAAKINSTFGGSCHFERACGKLLGIDCDSAVDGPYYYVKADTLETVASCGGYCMGGRCTNCPPKEWTCATY